MPNSTLLNNVSISVPRTSPGVSLSATGGSWTASLDTTAHLGSECDFTIQSSPNNNVWTDVSQNGFAGGDGTSHLGWDLSHQVQTFTLYGAGPWWRINVTRVVGTILVNTLIVTNT